MGLRRRSPPVTPAQRVLGTIEAWRPVRPRPYDWETSSLPVSPDTTRYLHELHESYVEKVNLAVEEGREDLIPGLVDAYFDEALRAITATGTTR
jgi:hypothetical protein